MIKLSVQAALAAMVPLCLATGCDFPMPEDDGSDTDGADTGGDSNDDADDGADDDSDDGADGGSDNGSDDGSDGADTTGGPMSTCEDENLDVLQHSGTIGSEVWGPAIHVVDSLTVEGALEVEGCAIIQMTEGATMTVRNGGSLVMLGEPDARITVTSDNNTAAPGDWNHIRIEASSSGPDNVLSHVDVEYGGGSYYGAIHVQNGASLSMSDSTVRYSGGPGMLVDESAELRDFVGNALTDNAGGALEIHPARAGDLGEGTYSPNESEGIFMRSGTVASDAVWLAHDAPYVSDGLTLRSTAGGAHVQVEAGATLLLNEGARVTVGENAGLTLAGTEDAPIIIDSSKASGEAGDWNDIRIEGSSVDAQNDFDWVEIRHGGGSYYGTVHVMDGASLAMTNSMVAEGDGPGMDVGRGSELRDFESNTLTGNSGGALLIRANGVDQLGPGTYSPNDVEGILVDDEDVDHDATWLAHDAPYVVLDRFYVETNAGAASLNVQAGAVLRMSDGAGLTVGENGSLDLAGTQADHVVVTSAKAAPAPGDWNEIRFENASVGPNNQLSYVDIEYGGGSYYGQVWLQNGAQASFDHVTFVGAGGGCDVMADGAPAYASTTVVECP